MPGEQDVDASTVDSPNPDPILDAAKPPVDAPMQAPPDAPVVMPPDACVPSAFEKLTNPVFDLSPTGTGWVDVHDPQLYPIIGSEGPPPHSAPNKAWLGGASGQALGTATVVDSLHQDVVIPANTTTVTITGYYLVGTNETTTTTIKDRFTLDVIQTNGTPIENVIALNNLTNAATFTAFSKTLTTNVAGQTIRLRATSTNDFSAHTNFFIDSLSLKATHCP